MDTLKAIWNGLDWTVLTDMLLGIIPALVCVTFHELSHGLIAFWLGDNTAKDSGRLTLNPLRHLDFMGLLMMLVFKFGWAKPVPVDMYRFRNPKGGMAVTAIAGPLSNLLLCVLFLFLLGFFEAPLSGNSFGYILLLLFYRTAYLSLALAVFNLIPIPPLDGSKVLFALIPDKAYYTLLRYEKYGMILLFALVASPFLKSPLTNTVQYFFDWLSGVEKFSAELYGRLFPYV